VARFRAAPPAAAVWCFGREPNPWAHLGILAPAPYSGFPAWNYPPTILNIVMFVIAAIAFTIVMTWVFNNTKGSLFIAVLVHTSFDMVFGDPK
jgi:hypothetical protein